MSKKMIARVVWLLVGALWLLAGPLGGAGASDTVAYRLKWLKNMSTVGDLAAESNGIFKASGFTVDVKAGGPERDALRELELGHAQFGVASADQVIRALSRGAPVVVIAQLFQVNPLQWMFRLDNGGVRTPADLKGKTIGVTFGKNDEIIMRTLLAGASLDESQVRLFSVRLDYTPFFKGRVDLWPVYINTQGIEIGGRLRRAGVNFGFFDPSRHGVRFVANSVVTSRRLMEQDPGLVKRFTVALLEGWRWSMDPANSDGAVAVVQAVDRDTTQTVLRAQLDVTRKLVRPENEAVIGSIDVEAWKQTEAIMLAHGQIDAAVNVADILMPVATNR